MVRRLNRSTRLPACPVHKLSSLSPSKEAKAGKLSTITRRLVKSANPQNSLTAVPHTRIMISAPNQFTSTTPRFADYEAELFVPEQASSSPAKSLGLTTSSSYISTLSSSRMMGVHGPDVYGSTPRKRGEKAESQVHSSTRFWKSHWSGRSTVLVVWMFVQGSISFLDMRNSARSAYDISVQAFKWLDDGLTGRHVPLNCTLSKTSRPPTVDRSPT